MVFPRFLLDTELNETTKLLYAILLDRARLSLKNEGWTDTFVHVFIYFTIEALAKVLHKSQMTIKTSLTLLEKNELILRKRQGVGQPNRIYVKFPSETFYHTDKNISLTQTENYPSDRQNPISEQWNSDEQLCIWRANWADFTNKMLAQNQIKASIDHRSFATQGISEQPTIHKGYIAQDIEKKGMIAERCEINRQIRADNKLLRELKAQVSKLAQSVEKSIPVIAETLEAIRNHMIFTQYHLLHNEMQKEMIHDWMFHLKPILNKYNTIKKKLKDKATVKKELTLLKDKTSFLNPIQHIKLNQQITTVMEEIEELKAAKEQLLFQAECSTDKDMVKLSDKYNQMTKNLDTLDSQDVTLKVQLQKDAEAFRKETLHPNSDQYMQLLDTRIQIRPNFREKLIAQLKSAFGYHYDYHYWDIAANKVDYLNAEDTGGFSRRSWELDYQKQQEMRKRQPVRFKKKSYDMEL